MTKKIAIITGSSRGIGAAIAEKLASQGMGVVINYAGRVEEAEQTVANIKRAGGEAIAIKANVSDPHAVRSLFDETEKHFGKVDILINSAGVLSPELPMLVATDDETFDRIFAINVKGSFNTMREAAKRLQDGGRIVNLSTSVIGMALPGYSVYAASKSAVETMTNILAKEMRGRSITVNAIAPGPTGTELFFNGKSDEQIERLTKAAPLERLGTPEDIAGAVAFLVSEEGSWINGQTLRANGGIV